MRVTLDANSFAQIEFSNAGLPEIVVRLLAFLAQESVEEIAQKKMRKGFIALHDQNLPSEGDVSPTKIDRSSEDSFEFQKLKDTKKAIDYDVNVPLLLSFFRSFCMWPEQVNAGKSKSKKNQVVYKEDTSGKSTDELDQEFYDIPEKDMLSVMWPPGEDIPSDDCSESDQEESEPGYKRQVTAG